MPVVSWVVPKPLHVYSLNRSVKAMVTESSFEVSIPSETTAGQEVQERIIAMLESFEFSARDVFGMRLALEEALVNAMKHGNKMASDKSVRVLCNVSSEKVYVEIEDEGEGFVLEQVPDPTEDENLEKPSGRGIMLMQAFLTVVEYNDRGNCVVLEKLREEEETE